MRYVKRRLEKIKSEMDEAKFLLSDSYRLFLQKIVHGITGRYDLKVIFSDGVYTDNKVISVNPVHEYVLKLERTAEKTLVVLGQLAHEVFHVIYTDFKVLKSLQREYEEQGEFRMRQVHESFNIIEDAAIELAGTNYYTGSFKQAIIANNKNALDCMPSLDEMMERGAPRLAIFKQACAMYCILGKLKGKLHDVELIELFQKAMLILDKGRLEPHSIGRYRAAEELYRLMEPLIEEAIERGQTEIVEIEYCYTKSDEISNGGSTSEILETPEIKEDFSEKSREKTKEELEKMKEKATGESDDKEDEESSGKAEGEGSEKEGGESDSSDVGGADSSESDDVEAGGGKGKGGKDDAGSDTDKADFESGDAGSDSPGDEDAKEMDDKESDGEKGEEGADEDTDMDDEMEELLESLEEQLKDTLEEAAKEEYDKEEQKKQDRAIREFAREVKYSEVHGHIKTQVIRDFNVDKDVIDKYEKQFESIKGLSRSLVKQVRDIIRYNEDVKTTGLLNGKINKSQLYRMDKHFFYKRQEKSDEADLAIVLLIDESGSMYRDNRSTHARQAAMLLYEMCSAINIPFAVIGYDAPFYEDIVRHRHYVDFDSRDKREKYKLAHIGPYMDNRDGFSIKYAGEYLLRRPEADKILIVITDGEPAHVSDSDYYSGEYGIKDSGRVVKELERKGVTIFGVAIGDGKSGIKRIFTRNYIDIPNLKRLPARLARLIESNILIE